MRLTSFVSLFVLLAMVVSTSLAADIAPERFEPRVYRSGDKSLPFRLLKPKDYDPDKQYPLVLFFHGAGERGDDNEKQLVWGMNDFAADEMMEKHPAFVVAPQCPEDEMWVDTPWTADSHVMPEEPTPAMRLSLQLVDDLRDEFPIDDERIYVTGLSMGGFGTWDAACRRPRLFAAAAPLCGGADVSQASKIAHVPVWAVHGVKDRVVKVKRSRDMIAALKSAGGEPVYIEHRDLGHNCWSRAYADPKFYDWLFQQRKGQ